MLKRVCNLRTDDGLIFWAVRRSFQRTELLVSVCQNCGVQFMNCLDFDHMTSDDMFCEKCLNEGVDNLFVEVSDTHRIDLVGTKGASRPSSRPRLSKRLKTEIFERDKHTCVYCEYSPFAFPGRKVNLHVDHVLPYSVGGSDVVENLVVACAKCNGIAGASVFPDLQSKRAYIHRVRTSRGLPITAEQWEHNVKPVFKLRQRFKNDKTIIIKIKDEKEPVIVENRRETEGIVSFELMMLPC